MEEEDYKKLFLEKYRFIRDNEELFELDAMYNDKIVKILEKIILEEKPLEEIDGYRYLEKFIDKKMSLKNVKFSVPYDNMIEKKLDEMKQENNFLISNKGINLFLIIYRNIAKEKKCKLKLYKMDVLCEYIRIALYPYINNDWKKDVKMENERISIVNYNNFINFFAKNHKLKGDINDIKCKNFHFSDREINKLYSETHNTKKRQKITCANKMCNKKFTLMDENIFIDGDGNYEVKCPFCGIYLILPDSMIPSELKEKIIYRNDGYYIKHELHRYNRRKES